MPTNPHDAAVELASMAEVNSAIPSMQPIVQEAREEHFRHPGVLRSSILTQMGD